MKIIPIGKIYLLVFFLSISAIQSQEASVEKSVFGIQTGFWGVWGYNEAKLSEKWALRTEIGLFDYLGLVEGIHLEPVITAEPRWYFNLNKRLSKGKRIDHNSGLYVAFRLAFRPDIFHLPVDPYEERSNPSIALVPYFGARKPLGKKMNYEIGFGLGAEYFSKGSNAFLDYNPAANFDSKFSLTFNFE